MRVFLLGPVPQNDDEVRVFVDTACKLAQAGYVPVMPYWFLVDGADADEELRRTLSAMLLADGIVLIKRNYHDRTVGEGMSLAKGVNMSSHTLPFWLNHHPQDFAGSNE